MLLESDFVTTVVGMLCTQPVNAMFTDQGFVPFQDHPLLILSYKKMSAAQLDSIHTLIEQMQETFLEYKVNPMMGGGSCVVIINQSKMFVDPSDVLTAFFMILHEMPQYTSNANQIFNLFVHRILCNINLPRVYVQQTQQKIHSMRLSANTKEAQAL